jgi:hypothetical protein
LTLALTLVLTLLTLPVFVPRMLRHLGIEAHAPSDESKVLKPFLEGLGHQALASYGSTEQPLEPT